MTRRQWIATRKRGTYRELVVADKADEIAAARDVGAASPWAVP
jgi:hypothetical protein